MPGRAHGQGQGRLLHGALAHVAPGLPRRPRTTSGDAGRSPAMAERDRAPDARRTGELGPGDVGAAAGVGRGGPGAGRPRRRATTGSSSSPPTSCTRTAPIRLRGPASRSASSTSASPSSTWCRWRPGWRRSATCPTSATFASFVGLLCGEQIRTDLAYPGLPVRILAHHAGISLGFYGTSHHATEDLGLMRSIAEA